MGFPINRFESLTNPSSDISGLDWLVTQRDIESSARNYKVNYRDLIAAPSTTSKRLYPSFAIAAAVTGSDDWNGVATKTFTSASFVLQHILLDTHAKVNLITMTTLKTNLGVAIADPELRSIKMIADGVLAIEIRSTASQLSYLYRSLDGGVHFGNNATADNLLPVLSIGHTGTTHQASCSLLSGENLCPVTIEGKPAVIAAWYNTLTGGTNTLAYQISYNAGLTWSTLGISNAFSRHTHLVKQDPYSGYIYFGHGDNAADCCILRWDGISTWPTGNFTHATMATQEGFDILRSADHRRYRPLSLFFSASKVYWTSDNRGSNAPTETGIWSVDKNLNADTVVKVSTVNAKKANLSGGTGITSKSGAFYCVEFAENENTDLRRQVFASFDQGATWKTIGIVQLRASGDATTRLTMFNVGSRVCISHYQVAGSAGKTYFYDEKIGEIDEPDALAPVFWVDASATNALDDVAAVVAANNLNQGGSPDYPWATPRYAYSSSHLTHGSRLMIKPGAYEQLSVGPLWTSATNPATAGEVTHTTPSTIDGRVELRKSAAEARVFYFATNNNNVGRYERIDFEAADNTGSLLEGNVTGGTGSTQTFDRCTFNKSLMLGSATARTVVQARTAPLVFKRSKIFGTTATTLVNANTYAPNLTFIMSALIGGVNGIVSAATTAVTLKNSIVTGQTTVCVKSTDPVKFVINNSFIDSIEQASPATPYTNADIDYSVINTVTGFSSDIFNTHGKAYSATVFPAVVLNDFSPRDKSYLTAGCTVSTGYDINLQPISDNFIGVMGQ